MDLSQTKLVTIVTEAVIERQLLDELDELGASGYTVTNARGRGHSGERHDGWEHTANIRIEVVCGQELANKILLHLKEHYYSHFAMVVYQADVGVLRPEKF